MVVIFFPWASFTGMVQELSAWPSMCTVQVPHSPIPQPYLVPVSLRLSRITQSSGVSGGTSTLTFLPFTFSAIMRLSPFSSVLAKNFNPVDPILQLVSCGRLFPGLHRSSSLIAV